MNARRAGAAVLLVASGIALAMLCWRGIYVRYNADDSGPPRSGDSTMPMRKV